MNDLGQCFFPRSIRIPLTLPVLLGMSVQLSGCGAASSAAPPGMKLVWADEFNGGGAPDPDKWDFDLGGRGWGNNEIQHYTDSRSNSYVRGGSLHIAARNENGRWTSARLKTKGKADWTYGYFEIRAKLPAGTGTWPAIWMLPSADAYGPWPNSGEIDIMEHVGFDPNRIHTTAHTGAFNHRINTQKTKSAPIEKAAERFHIYGMTWDKDRIQWSIDGEPFFQFEPTGKNPAEWPFDKPFHLVLNVAIGGSWGGQHGVDPALREAVMEIDYVRVYQSKVPNPDPPR
ncbi:MAG: glycoside hydrolase family 16 protein [Treponema sp.]|jgi:beta-glucanase (GH16 family)|nr:glycoside hydrolase family 16 protein [Treponema sp.]